MRWFKRKPKTVFCDPFLDGHLTTPSPANFVELEISRRNTMCLGRYAQRRSENHIKTLVEKWERQNDC